MISIPPIPAPTPIPALAPVDKPLLPPGEEADGADVPATPVGVPGVYPDAGVFGGE